MDWTVILDAATGRAEAINRAVWLSWDECAALATLLLLEETPHPATAPVAVATVRENLAAPIATALAPHVAPALAAWRADPQWAERAVGDQARRKLPWGVARMVAALRADPAALHDAATIVLRDGDLWDVSLCLEALGAPGWTALGDDERRTLLTRAPADALGRVWAALSAAQRATTVQQAARRSDVAAALIGAIGAAAWRATDPALRKRLIDAAARAPSWVCATAPAWTGMTDDERTALARAVIALRDASAAFVLLEALGVAGRGALTADQRAALERRAMVSPDGWIVLAWRAADDGWTALTDEERAVVMAQAEREGWNVQRLLRAVGAAGWRAMTADEQARMAVAVRRTPDAFFRCPPALWGDLAGDALSPATEISWDAPEFWRAEDVDADLGDLPPAHQAVVLALAPWRTEDAAKDSVRMQRLRAAWTQTSADERAALVMKHPSVLAPVAAAARLAGGAADARDAAGETVVRGAATTDGVAARRIVGAMLRTPDDWRAWMIAFAPSDGDPQDVWKTWIAAARCGSILDPSLCARLAAKEREESTPSRALRRT